MSRLGVLGGTFDPIHVGHLNAAEQVRQACRLDGVIFVPAGDPYQKPVPGATVADRVAMTELAIADHPNFSLSRVDVDRDGPTYTVDTLADLERVHPGAEFWVIIGVDALAGFGTWREPERITELARLAVMARPGVEFVNPGVPLERLILVETELVDVSSTQIRDRVRAGLPIDGMVTPAVAQYIERQRLYQA